jgi:hypothetical protein
VFTHHDFIINANHSLSILSLSLCLSQRQNSNVENDTDARYEGGIARFLHDVETESLVNCIDGMFVHEKSRLDVLVSLTGTRLRDFGIVFSLFFVRCARALLYVCILLTLTMRILSYLFVMFLSSSSLLLRMDANGS